MAVSEYALCTLAALKRFMGLPADAADYDTALEEIIDAVTAVIERYADRKLAARDYSWEIDGNSQSELVLPQWPVNSIDEITVNGVEVTARESVTSTGYVLDGDSGILTWVGGVFGAGIKNVAISANAGYSAIPDDLAQAAKDWAARIVRDSGIGGGDDAGIGDNWLGVKSEARPHDQGTLTIDAEAMPKRVRLVVDTYRRRVFA